ncbi:MAG: hypothetical protein A2Y38_03705 [Spirochaetes bacterium GWB1_59_5]|nr:MAG: hypothetical protein A2Y38_03705 [Spirochaetes bacterium GWB1_59_5]
MRFGEWLVESCDRHSSPLARQTEHGSSACQALGNTLHELECLAARQQILSIASISIEANLDEPE